MAFNSLPFLVFILLFFLFWPWFKRKYNLKFLFIVISSFILYGWWDWRFLFLILFSGFVDFFAARAIGSDPKRAKFWLVLSVVVNLASLSLFKYSTFFATQLEHLSAYFSIPVNLVENLPEFTYILPVGISFYTFQSMSYTIDVYRGKLKPTTNVVHFFSYLVMFPQLVAGPIVRAKDFLYQLKKNRLVSGIEFWNGIKLIILGYFQKTVLADNLGVFVDNAFAGVNNGFGLYWWVVMLCFSFQIYFDFSGYTQIARGLAKLMGYHFKMNFNHPHLAVSLRDFWGRWHISLSTWFRDYVYIPLGGSRKGKLRSHLNLWATMLLSGLWHGAQLNFVLWGAYHGVILSLERILKKSFSKNNLMMPKIVNWGITMVLVLIGWVLFRATSSSRIVQIIKGLFVFDFTSNFIRSYLDSMVFLVIAMAYEGFYPLFKKYRISRMSSKNSYFEPFVYAVCIAAILFFRGPEKEFIYFQF
jgi:D-alanyl-lipoteichoic acid acyltransferase DltB (MBOAT superfamily)